MSRDPLEGVRPSDSEPPAFSRLPPAASPGPANSPGVSQRVSSGSARGKALLLTYIGVMLAILAGAFVYFLTLPRASTRSNSTPSAGVEPTVTATPREEMVVKQGPATRADPAPVPTTASR